MRTITTYETKDGKRFNDYNQAKLHEEELKEKDVDKVMNTCLIKALFSFMDEDDGLTEWFYNYFSDFNFYYDVYLHYTDEQNSLFWNKVEEKKEEIKKFLKEKYLTK